MSDQLVQKAYTAVLSHLIEHKRAPHYTELADQLGVSIHDVKWPVVKAAHSSFFAGCEPAWTVVGVESLARPDLMIEIEATAASD